MKNDNNIDLKIRTDILIEQLKFIVKNNETFVQDGFEIVLNSNSLSIKFNKSWYWISIVELDDAIVWYLKPYNHSYFTTAVDDKGVNFKMVLWAIKDNDVFFKNDNKKGKGENYGLENRSDIVHSFQKN